MDTDTEVEMEIEGGCTSTCPERKRELPHGFSEHTIHEPCASKRRLHPAAPEPDLISIPGLIPIPIESLITPPFGRDSVADYEFIDPEFAPAGADKYQRLFFTDKFNGEESYKPFYFSSYESDRAYLKLFARLLQEAVTDQTLEEPELECRARELQKTEFPCMSEELIWRSAKHAYSLSGNIVGIGKLCEKFYQLWKTAVVAGEEVNDALLFDVFELDPPFVRRFWPHIIKRTKEIGPMIPENKAREIIHEFFSKKLKIVDRQCFDYTKRKIELAKDLDIIKEAD